MPENVLFFDINYRFSLCKLKTKALAVKTKPLFIEPKALFLQTGILFIDNLKAVQSSYTCIRNYHPQKTKKAKGSEHRVLLPLALIYVLRTNSYDSD